MCREMDSISLTEGLGNLVLFMHDSSRRYPNDHPIPLNKPFQWLKETCN